MHICSLHFKRITFQYVVKHIIPTFLCMYVPKTFNSKFPFSLLSSFFYSFIPLKIRQRRVSLSLFLSLSLFISFSLSLSLFLCFSLFLSDCVCMIKTIA